jgi:hypothetical protein
MTGFDIDAALAAANPLSTQAAQALPLQDAEAEMRERILAIPVGPRHYRGPRRTRVIDHARGLKLSPRRVGLVLAGTAVVAAVLALLPSSERSVGPQPAFAASLVRFANHSPKVLLRLPGWHVTFVEQDPNGYGEMHWVRGPATTSGNPKSTSHTAPQPSSHGYQAPTIDRVASLTWEPVSPQVRKYDAAGHEDAPTGLGVAARRYTYEGGAHGVIDMSAYFVYRGRDFHFRATVSSMSMYRQELRALTAVDTNTWLRAMPPSVIKSADSAAQVHQMLKGIPLPPRFDASTIHGAKLVQNRYYLATEVTGTVACMWIGDWFRARRTGDKAMVKRAVAAMATSPHWPVFKWMNKQGAWGQVLISYARAMPRDRIAEGSIHPLSPADVNDGLGCRQLGVKLGR